MRKIAQGDFYPNATFSVLFIEYHSQNCCQIELDTLQITRTAVHILGPAYPIGTALIWTTTAAVAAGTRLNAHRWPMLPWPGRGGWRVPGMPGFRGTSTTSSAPTGWLSGGVTPNPCPQPGNKRVAAGAPDARRRVGNAWQPLHFSAVAHAMGSVLWTLPTAIS